MRFNIDKRQPAAIGLHRESNWWEESSNVLGLCLRRPFVVLSLTDMGRGGWWCHLGLTRTAHAARPLAVPVPGLSHPPPEPRRSCRAQSLPTGAPGALRGRVFNLIQNGHFSMLHRHKWPPPFTPGLGGVAAGHVPLLCQGIAQLKGAESTH